MKQIHEELKKIICTVYKLALLHTLDIYCDIITFRLT